jgi:hypothetical protein
LDAFLKTLRAFSAALALFGVGLACGCLVRWIGPRNPMDADSLNSPARGDPKSTVQGDSSPTSEAKEKSRDFAARLNALANTISPHKRTRAIAGIADELDASDIREALGALETRSVRDAMKIRLQLLWRWAELEPEAALQYAEALPHGYEAPDAITAVIRSWAAVDAKAAEEGVARMPENSAKEIARHGLLDALAESDPRRAFANRRRSSYINGLFKNWAQNDPTEAAAQAAQLPAGWNRSQALGEVAQQWAETDRDAALAWAQSWQPANPPGVTIECRDPGPLAAVLQTWMNEDGDTALQWLKSFPMA